MGSGKKSAPKHAAAAIGVAGAGAGFGAGPAGEDIHPAIEVVQGWAADIQAMAANAPKTAEGVLAFLATEAVSDTAMAVWDLKEGDAAKEAPKAEKQKAVASVAHPTAAFLASVPAPELQKAALAKGFPHPTLVGHGYAAKVAAGKKATHPLAVWLNPFYGAAVKDKIAAKAVERFDALTAEQQQQVLQTEATLAAATTPKAEPIAAPAAPPTPLPPLPFQQKLLALQGILAQRRVAGQLPPWKDRAAVESLALRHVRAAEDLGGVHEKHLYADPSGQQWLFKVDRHGGAAAAAEECAAAVARRVGLPGVQAVRVTLDGAEGSLQPYIANAGKLPPDPAAWTPDQAQGVMMHHVVDWLVGDHDGNAPNFLLVEGAPVRVDRGQAWKFAGQDRLALDYEPNKNRGAPPHAAILLYRAARAGKVKVNPHFVLPVIQAAEAIPDDEYRAMLRPVAEAGVAAKRKAGWYGAASDRARKALGREPKAAEVAEAFLNMAVERKRRLRQDFEALFSDVLKQPFTFGAAP